MKNVIHLILIVIISFTASEVIAQENNKKRGDTDYTNNRSSRKKENKTSANTKQETPVKIIEFLPGTWTVEKVYRGKKDITSTDTLAQSQTIEFTRDAKFIAYSANEQIDSGTFRVNEQQAILYLISERTEEPQEWNVGFDPKGTMTMRMRNSSGHGESISYVYRRTSNTASRK